MPAHPCRHILVLLSEKIWFFSHHSSYMSLCSPFSEPQWTNSGRRRHAWWWRPTMHPQPQRELASAAVPWEKNSHFGKFSRNLNNDNKTQQMEVLDFCALVCTDKLTSKARPSVTDLQQLFTGLAWMCTWFRLTLESRLLYGTCLLLFLLAFIDINTWWSLRLTSFSNFYLQGCPPVCTDICVFICIYTHVCMST